MKSNSQIEAAIQDTLEDLEIEMIDEFPEIQVGDLIKVLKVIAEDAGGTAFRHADPGDLGVCCSKGPDGCPLFQFQRTGSQALLDDGEYVVLNAEALKEELLEHARLLRQARQEMGHLAAAMKDVYIEAHKQQTKTLAKKRGN